MDIDWDTVDDAPRIDKCLKLTTVQGKIVSVYDGDSVKALLPLNGTLYKWSCRLLDIDTPELRTRYKKENIPFFYRYKWRPATHKAQGRRCLQNSEYLI